MVDKHKWNLWILSFTVPFWSWTEDDNEKVYGEKYLQFIYSFEEVLEIIWMTHLKKKINYIYL